MGLRGCKRTPVEERFWPKVKKGEPNECWPWQAGKHEKGYGIIGIGRKTYKAHRVVWFIEHGVWPELHVLHSCDNPPCVNPNHLFLGTNYDNVQDMINKGRNQRIRGEQANGAKLTTNKVLEIKELLNNGMQGAKIARMFGVTRVAIYDIKTGKTWRHLQ